MSRTITTADWIDSKTEAGEPPALRRHLRMLSERNKDTPRTSSSMRRWYSARKQDRIRKLAQQLEFLTADPR